jgi:hypothetical protein
VQPKIALPKIKRVNISGNQDIFDAFDFRGSGALIFHGAPWDERDRTVEINLSSFPDQITKISLVYVEWNQKPIHPYRFQDLLKLELNWMNISGTLGEYLHAPNLKHLIISMVTFKELEGTGVQDRKRTGLFSDTKFLQGTPMLETITFEREAIDEKFVEGLGSCTLLKSLTLLRCDLSHFVSPFLERLESGEVVSSLDTVVISKSWEFDPGMTFEEFRQYFMVKRPNVRLSEYYHEGH